ncbi:hypothetical protein NDU88_004772 [Pleurodeles waltl]|uniref:Uncharacterized protein n=1 Tax=Pleurodeles waltl TaxID=8319 RepID=A0AAV7VJN3_PLEWA|nr:hypothetical protein NDU88_004772 [Pleurodeles waltl]
MYGRALTPFQDGGAVRRAPEGPPRLGRASRAQAPESERSAEKSPSGAPSGLPRHPPPGWRRTRKSESMRSTAASSFR